MVRTSNWRCSGSPQRNGIFCKKQLSYGQVTMKQDIHPEYRPVVFKDVGGDFAFLSRSTVQTDETIEWEDGHEYPLVKLEVSSATHPFYTGKQNILDATGKVEKFRQRYGMK